jgi:hypothetical protein
MLSGHRSARRPRRNSRSARIAVSLAIPMALGLTLGIVIAVSGAGRAMTIEQSALGACASAAADVNGAASGRTSPLSYPTLGGPEKPGASQPIPGRHHRGWRTSSCGVSTPDYGWRRRSLPLLPRNPLPFRHMATSSGQSAVSGSGEDHPWRVAHLRRNLPTFTVRSRNTGPDGAVCGPGKDVHPERSGAWDGGSGQGSRTGSRGRGVV